MRDDDDDLVEQVDDDDEQEQEQDYCARCRYASRCMGYCAVPPELF